MNKQNKIDFLLAKIERLEKGVELLKGKHLLIYGGESSVNCVSRHHLPSEQSQITQPIKL